MVRITRSRSWKFSAGGFTCSAAVSMVLQSSRSDSRSAWSSRVLVSMPAVRTITPNPEGTVSSSRIFRSRSRCPALPGRLAPVAARIELEVDLVERQEPGALSSIVDEGGLQGGVDPFHDDLENVPFEMFFAEGLDLEDVEDAVLDDRDAVFLFRGHVDEHRFWH